jgi:chaperonin cofactor prefoldin
MKEKKLSEAERPKLYKGTIEVKTSSVAKSISDLTEREKVHPASVDFDILKVETLIKEPSKDEYVAINKTHVEKLRDKTYLLDPKLAFAQEYEVRFKPVAPLPFKFHMALSVDKFRSVAHIALKAGSIVRAGVDSKALFLYFNKIKLKNGALVYLFDDSLRAAVVKLSQLANNEPFAEDFGFALCAWPQPTETIDDRLIWRYRDKLKPDAEADRINYADRGFVAGVSKDELLIEYVMPSRGKNGRSFDGKFIEAPEPKAEHMPQFTADSVTIDVKEENGKKLFFAKDNGYVKLENNVLAIDKTIAVSEVSLKTTGNLRAGLDRDVKIRIEGKDPSEEVIGADMVVEASEVYASGSVASGALVTADKIVVKGQTHQKSELIGKRIEVNVLRGLARGEEVFARTLEGGNIVALNAEIEQAVGGEVKSKTIKVGNLRGKVCLRATKAIVVSQVSKGENRLIVDGSVDDAENEEIKAAREQIGEFKSRIEEHKRAKDVSVAYLSKNLNAYKQIQEKIAEDRKGGRLTGETFLKMAREYKIAQKKHDDLEAEIELLTSQIREKRSELERFDKEVLEARVTNEGSIWKGHNEVVFKMPFLGREYVQNIDDGMRVKGVRLVESQEEGEYEIKLTY